MFARHFHGLGERGWAAYSLVTGIGFLMVFGGVASGAPSGALMLAFYAAVAWIWGWHTAVLARLMHRDYASGSGEK